MTSQRFDFTGAQGQRLAGRLEIPAGSLRGAALFAHCFACGKDVFAASRLADGLTARAVAVLRFDFTGLGASEGEFGNGGFSANIADLIAAAGAMREAGLAPTLLIGHSLGGAAVLATAGAIPETRAVVTIGAPFDARHVLGLFKDQLPTIEAEGVAEIRLGGRAFKIDRAFVDDVRRHGSTDHIAELRRALLVMHAPGDAIVGIDNAARIFERARHPKSFVSLDDADHLLGRRSDAEYVAGVIVAWAARYLPPAP